MNAPASGFARLVQAEADGRLGELAQAHGLALVVVFGSVARGADDPHDLDVAVSAGGVDPLDPVAVVTALMALTDVDDVDLLDLDRAGAVARQHALVGGIPLYERPPGEFVRQQMRASGERLSTEWMRRRHLERLAGR